MAAESGNEMFCRGGIYPARGRDESRPYTKSLKDQFR
jgi:hypothetical protein